jgi:hypothetical protein
LNIIQLIKSADSLNIKIENQQEANYFRVMDVNYTKNINIHIFENNWSEIVKYLKILREDQGIKKAYDLCNKYQYSENGK